MKMNSRKPPYRLPTDSVPFQRAMKALDDSGIIYYRPTDFLLKAGHWNYYPDRQSLQEDGRKKLPAAQSVERFIERILAEAEAASRIAREYNKNRPLKRE